MYVMGGGRVAPNPSNEVDIYDPGTNTWTTGSPVPAFTTARRNFPTDTDGTTRIWLAGGYDATGVPAGLDGNLLPRRWNANANTDGNSDGYSNSYGNCHSDGNSHSLANGDTNTHAVRRKMYSDAAASSDSSASPVSGFGLRS